MIGITTLARRVFGAVLALGLLAVVAAPAASAQETPAVRQFFEEGDLADVNAAAAYLGLDLQSFAQTSVEVHFFLLSIGGKLGADECSLGYNVSIERHDGQTQAWFGYPGDLAAKFVAISDHYCLDDLQTQRFNLTLLTFLVASNAGQAGLALPDVGVPSHAARTNGFDIEPVAGWAAHFDQQLADLAALDVAGLGGCDSAASVELLADLVALLYDTWSHPEATQPTMRDHVSNIYGRVELRNAAVCAGDIETELSHTGAATYFADVADAYHRNGDDWSADTEPLGDHEVVRANRAGTVWDIVVSLVEVMLDAGQPGLHAGACWSVDTSRYNETAQDLVGWQASIDAYLAANVIPVLDQTGLIQVRDLLASTGSMLTDIHNARCRRPMDDAAAMLLLEPYSDLLFDLVVLMNVGYSAPN